MKDETVFESKNVLMKDETVFEFKNALMKDETVFEFRNISMKEEQLFELKNEMNIFKFKKEENIFEFDEKFNVSHPNINDASPTNKDTSQTFDMLQDDIGDNQDNKTEGGIRKSDAVQENGSSDESNISLRKNIIHTHENIQTENEASTTSLSFMCCQCNKPHNSIKCLKTHMKSHLQREIPETEAPHMTRINEHPYKCNVCYKILTSRGHLKVHERIHAHQH